VEKAAWLRYSSVEDPPGIFSFVAPRHPAFSPKTAPLVIFRQALRDEFNCVPDSAVITSATNYIGAPFPEGGTSSMNNPSKAWEAGTGDGRVVTGWAYFGTSREVGTRYNVRFNTRRFDFGDVEYRWKFRSGPFGGL
jgi:hypothetical protein